MRWLAIAVVISGCDDFYGLSYQDPCPGAIGADLDGDGVDDGCDPCIAPASDNTTDFDGDTVPNGSDSCPWDPAAPPLDSDGDGIPDQCDPFPDAPDHVRCLMMFTSPTLTAKLWAPALASSGFAVVPGALHADANSARIASAVTESIDVPGATTSYQVFYETTAASSAGHFAALPRVSGNHFLGCEVDIDASGKVSLAVISNGSLSSTMTDNFVAPANGKIDSFLTGQLVAGQGQDSITCEVFAQNDIDGAGGLDTIDILTTGTSPDVAGTFGMFNQTWATDVLGLEVYDER